MKKRIKLEKSGKFLGAHVSAAGGLSNSVKNMMDIDATSCSFFLKPRTWKYSDLTISQIEEYKEACRESKVDMRLVLPHAQYLINLASPDIENRKRAFDYFQDDIHRCWLLGIKSYNIHPGSTTGKCTREEGIANIADCINRVHGKIAQVSVILENMAGQGNVIGGKFEDLADIIAKIEDKSRIGVCLDTCHLFASGYDLRTRKEFDSTFEMFDKIVGWKYLRAMHINDCKSEFGSKLDRHENIGKGKIGMEPFKWLMKSPKFDDIPLILETPNPHANNQDIWAREIKLLKSFE